MLKPLLRPTIYFSLVFHGFQAWNTNGFADDPDPQQVVWEETRALLQRREYALAVNLLESRLEDPDLFQFTSRFQEDLDAVKKLQKLSASMEYAVSRLPKSTPLTVVSKDYRFGKRLEDASGTKLVLIDVDGDEVTYPLNRLDSATWLQVLKPELDGWFDQHFVTGIFLAFDRYPNTRIARNKLNLAAAAGQNVTVWISRLDQAAEERKPGHRPGGNEPSAKDLLLGKWNVAIKNGPRIEWEFRRGGTGVVTFKGRRQRATWEEESNGVFRFTNPQGVTAVVHVAGDRIFGRLTRGTPFRGVRQAK